MRIHIINCPPPSLIQAVRSTKSAQAVRHAYPGLASLHGLVVCRMAATFVEGGAEAFWISPSVLLLGFCLPRIRRRLLAPQVMSVTACGWPCRPTAAGSDGITGWVRPLSAALPGWTRSSPLAAG